MAFKNEIKTLLVLLGLAWGVIVMASYYSFNTGYYTEKLSTFGRFFAGFLG